MLSLYLIFKIIIIYINFFKIKIILNFNIFYLKMIYKNFLMFNSIYD